jgi:hypothetical protein
VPPGIRAIPGCSPALASTVSLSNRAVLKTATPVRLMNALSL